MFAELYVRFPKFVVLLVLVQEAQAGAFEDSIQDLPLKPGDKIVLAQSSGGDSDFLPMKNPPGKEAMCFGLTAIPQILFKSSFDPSKPRPSNHQLHLQLMDAAKNKPVTFNGFKDPADFIAKVFKKDPDDPIMKAALEIQKNHSIKVSSNGEATASLSFGNQGPAANRFAWDAVHTSATLQARSIASTLLNQHRPVWTAVLEKDAKDTVGHSLPIVGYILSADEQKKLEPPHRFIVRDPNFPDQAKILYLKDDQFTYEMPQGTGGTKSKLINLAIQSLSPTDSAAISQKFKTVESFEPYLPGECQPKSSIAQILNSADR